MVSGVALGGGDARRSPRESPRTGDVVTEFTNRLAVLADVPALTVLMDAAISELQRGFLDDAEIASSRAIMGMDTQLIEDGTYFVMESGGDLAGCGGWSRRATLYGGNQTPGRDSNLLDPTIHPARVRAMYTSPAFARRGVGRLVLSLCEAAAAAEGFTRLELMSTLSGEPLYTAYGFRPLERVVDATGGVPVPLVRMEKPVDPSLLA
jgi:GNAT superfamily N-acetyltransferase